MSKRKRKKGRMRQPGKREPNGRLSRKVEHVKEREDMTTREAQSVMIAARMRQTGLSEAQVSSNDAGRPNAGTIHGIMCLRGEITREQWDAAEWWIGTRIAYLRSIQAAAVRTGYAPPGDGDEAAHAQWCRAIAATWDALTDCIRDVMAETRLPIASALDVILLREQDMPHMVGDLRIALNAIHRRFLAGAREAA